MPHQCIILAGGKGTRLKERLGDLPKPLIPIAGKSLLEHQLELARAHGFRQALLFVCHQAERIRAHLGDGQRFGLRIEYILEREPRGTAGAVLDALPALESTFAVFYGDTLVNVDLGRFCAFHETTGGAATLLLHPNDHPLDSDLVEVDASHRIRAFHHRPHPPERYFQNLVNAGLYILNKSALAQIRAELPQAGIVDFGKDVFPHLLRAGVPLYGYSSPEFIKDIGTPERYDRVCAEWASGVVQASSLAVPQRAVFLDRDGTLIRDVDNLRSAEQLELLPGVATAIARLNHAGSRAIVITNQPVLAKGWCTEAELQRIHNKLETLLGREHAFLDRIYFCPHHPDTGFPGERTDLKIRCDCRKPAIGMIATAARELNLDLRQCWLIGDTTRDLQTAANAGIRSILVRTGYAGSDARYAAQPDYVADDLGQAVEHIFQQPSV